MPIPQLTEMKGVHRVPRTGAGTRLLGIALVSMALSGCGGGDGGGPNPSAPVIAKAPAASGDGQSGVVAQALADSFRVVVTEGGAAKAGVTVSWTAQTAGAAMNPATSGTDAQGQAASRMTLGQAAGAQSTRAAIGGNLSVTFNVTATPGPAAQLAVVAGNNQAALANAAVTQPLQVRVRDQFSNPINGSPVFWSIASGSATLSAATSLTAATGIASINLTLGGSAGAVQIRAVSAGADTVFFTAHAVNLVRDVLVKNNFFESVTNGTAAPSIDTIPAGEAMRWIWQSGNTDHNIIPTGSPLFQGISGSIVSPFTHGPIRFAAPGTYHYDCNLHAGMSGIVVVE